MTTCGRCLVEDHPSLFRMALVNLRREAREDGRQHDGPDFTHDIRCKDREASPRARQPPKGARMNPDPLRPVDTDDIEDPMHYSTGAALGLLLAAASGFIVGILVAWAVR